MIFSKNTKKNRIFDVVVYMIYTLRENLSLKTVETNITYYICYPTVASNYGNELYCIQAVDMHVVVVNKLNF